ncbi:hypothetical protein ADICYQ_2944 [Cyclobacterium qasimii M12-11B]|uniref:Uncharacterized protein n=1 Tax=Cyclobacterium qasimii M12-11B TaxID=641524 RepID=S7VEA2_9BACT|nr:hypothetical protein ADICYQ_2944 [Cyclobacterium qasimii M12-11B]
MDYTTNRFSSVKFILFIAFAFRGKQFEISVNYPCNFKAN